jgi:hypothetical protein
MRVGDQLPRLYNFCRGLGEPLDSVKLLHSNWEMKAPLCTRLSERAVQTEEK